ncbi:MAG: heat-inducible transcriptional repressor HrcA [Propionibacteriaceae bacterium]
MLDDRKLQVLRAIVADYVGSQEPVGSRTLVERHRLNVSPATVRNDMAALEDEGYITQPHTSAGRIPTDKGYRLFVDRLAGVKPLSPAEKRAIETVLSGAVDLDDIVTRTVRLLAQITHQVAIVQYPIRSTTTMRHVELVSLTPDKVLLVAINSAGHVEQRTMDIGIHDETSLSWLKSLLNDTVVGHTSAVAAERLSGVLTALAPAQRSQAAVAIAALLEIVAVDPSTRVAVAGVTHVADFGADFTKNVRPVLEALEEQVVLLKLLGEAATSDDVTVLIGREHRVEGLSATSLVASPYGEEGEAWASLGIVGPTRMDYESKMASVRAVARYVGRYLAEG